MPSRANEDQAEANSTAEALVSMLGQVGVKLNFRPVTSAARRDIETSGEWDMHVSREGQVYALPFTRPEEMGPIAKTQPAWHREGDEPRELQPFEEELVADHQRVQLRDGSGQAQGTALRVQPYLDRESVLTSASSPVATAWVWPSVSRMFRRARRSSCTHGLRMPS